MLTEEAYGTTNENVESDGNNPNREENPHKEEEPSIYD
jgi:hypothetical protein